MGRTVNRQPFNVKTPTSNEVKDYFFNQINWKGMNDNRNFLSVDQETFESCDNVYVNSEGLLRSRPAIKLADSTHRSIVNIKPYGDYEVHTFRHPNSNPVLYGIKVLDKRDNKTYTSANAYTVQPVSLFIENVIYFFGSIYERQGSEPECFNTLTDLFEPMVSHLYIPETKIISGQEEVENETENALIGSKKEVYLYQNDLTLRGDIDGKNITFTIDGTEYSRETFDSNETLVFFQKFLNLSENFTESIEDFYMESHWNGTNDTFFVYSKTTGQLMYSPDGKTYTVTTTFSPEYINGPTEKSKILVRPRFTADGHHVYRGTEIISVVKDVEIDGALTYRFSTVTDLQRYFDAYSEGEAGGTFYVISHNHGLLLKRPEISGSGYFRLYEDISAYTDYKFEYDSQFPSGYIYDIKYLPNYENSKHVAIYRYDPTAGKSFLNIYALTEPNEPATYGVAKLICAQETPFNSQWALFTNYDNILTFACSLSDGAYIYKYTNRNLSSIKFSDTGYSYIKAAEFGKYIATENGIYDLSTQETIPYLISDVRPLAFGKYLYFIKNNDHTKIYSTSIVEPVTLTNLIPGEFNNELMTTITTHAILNENYIGADKTLFISLMRHDKTDKYLLYLPTINKRTFNYPVTGLVPISSTEMGVFLSEEIWYVRLENTEETSYYRFIKSKLDTGLRKGSDVVLSADGTNVIFTNERGLAALAYQNFVATTDQTLAYLSDNIFETLLNFINSNTQGIKLLKYKFWILLYKENDNKVFLLDLRTGGWWPWTLCGSINRLFVDNYNDLSVLRGVINNSIVTFDLSDENYYDCIDSPIDIVWNFKSQKLHFNAINYYKHISNLTLYSVLDSENDAVLSFYLQVNNYRKKIDTTEVQSVEYDVDTIRTFVKRVNYPKVNEFQYEIHYKDEDGVKYPLSLSGLTIKYKINGQVR